MSWFCPNCNTENEDQDDICFYCEHRRYTVDESDYYLHYRNEDLNIKIINDGIVSRSVEDCSIGKEFFTRRNWYVKCTDCDSRYKVLNKEERYNKCDCGNDLSDIEPQFDYEFIGISAPHCKFTIENGDKIYIEDLGSLNHIRINNSPIPQGYKVRVQLGAIIRIGNVPFELIKITEDRMIQDEPIEIQNNNTYEYVLQCPICHETYHNEIEFHYDICPNCGRKGISRVNCAKQVRTDN